MTQNNYTKQGIGFTGILTIAFIVLKLCNVIEWSWLWVLSPLWIPFAVVFCVIILVFVLKCLID